MNGDNKTSKEYRSAFNMLRHDVITELIRKVGKAYGPHGGPHGAVDSAGRHMIDLSGLKTHKSYKYYDDDDSGETWSVRHVLADGLLPTGLLYPKSDGYPPIPWAEVSTEILMDTLEAVETWEAQNAG